MDMGIFHGGEHMDMGIAMGMGIRMPMDIGMGIGMGMDVGRKRISLRAAIPRTIAEVDGDCHTLKRAVVRRRMATSRCFSMHTDKCPWDRALLRRRMATSRCCSGFTNAAGARGTLASTVLLRQKLFKFSRATP
jgi:hypothetical protein